VRPPSWWPEEHQPWTGGCHDRGASGPLGASAWHRELHRRAIAKVAEIDAKIGQLTQMREALLAVMAARCDSLTDCSCGQSCPLPTLELTGHLGL